MAQPHKPRPCLFLAFANDPADHSRYLRNLHKEVEQLKSALTQAQEAGLCELVIRQNVSLDDIFGVFQDAAYRDRIVLFHYAGHANSYQLLLENAGQVEAAHSEGLAELLGNQRRLRLVFLNGCATAQHASGLLDTQVPMVIATNQLTDDAVATQFATRFYTGLSRGANIKIAFSEAQADVVARFGKQARFGPKKPDVDNEDDDHGGSPWQLYVKPGAEQAHQWSLPIAAGDPLFGLPAIPTQDLPDSPYRHLQWFESRHAELFFGRGVQIRQLYERIIDTTESPILLVHGASGVGKSSFLAAGLVPRLTVNHRVIFLRRDFSVGLNATLQSTIANTLSEDGKQKQDSAQSIVTLWRAIESHHQCPCIVIIDQLEEVLTHPNPRISNEVPQFIELLTSIFVDQKCRPQGKLLLSIRKEWLPDLDQTLTEAELSHSSYYLQPLDKPGIIEAILGPVQYPRTAQHYQLSIESGLATQIADTLLQDLNSPVAPVLQILLSKLWHSAKSRDHDTPVFDEPLYRQLETAGLLLDDYLNQILAQLHAQRPSSVESGLALDILAHLTTVRGTAAEQSLEDLRQLYSHVHEHLNATLTIFKNNFLLLQLPGTDQSPEKIRLVHDTLAPLIRASFEESDRPGQRARRILESRIVEWQDGPGTPLDDRDLQLVELGRQGMRCWSHTEQQLVNLSRRQSNSRRRRRRIWQISGIAAVIVITISALMAFWQRNEAIGAKKEAESQKSVAVARRLASEANNIMRNSQTAAALLTVESLHQAYTLNGYQTWQRLMAMLPSKNTIISIKHKIFSFLISDDEKSMIALGGDHNAPEVYIWDLASNKLMKSWSHPLEIKTMSADPNGHRFAISDNKGMVYFVDSASGAILEKIKLDAPVEKLAFLPNDNFFASVHVIGTHHMQRAVIVDAHRNQHSLKTSDPGGVYLHQIDTKHSNILTAGFDHKFKLWNANNFELIRELNIKRDPQFMDFYFNGTHIAYRERKHTISIFSLVKNHNIATFNLPSDIRRYLINPHATQLAVIKSNYEIELWDIQSENKIASFHIQNKNCIPIEQNKNICRAVKEIYYNSRGDKFITVANNGSVFAWESKNGKLLWNIDGQKEYHTYFCINSTSSLIATYTKGKPISIRNLSSSRVIKKIENLSGKIPNYMRFSPNSKNLLVFFNDQTAVIYRILDGRQLKTIDYSQFSSQRVVKVDMSPDNRLVATATSANTLAIVDVSKHKLIKELKLNHLITDYYFLSNHSLLTADTSGNVELWDVYIAKRIGKLSHDGVYEQVYIDPESKYATFQNGQSISIYSFPGKKWNTLTRSSPDLVYMPVISGDDSRYLPEIDRHGLTEPLFVTPKNISHTPLINLNRDRIAIRAQNDKNGSLSIFLRHSGKMDNHLQMDTSISAVSFNPTGKAIWIGTGNKSSIMDKNGRVLATMSHQGDVKKYNVDSNYRCIAVETSKGVEVFQRDPNWHRTLTWPGSDHAQFRNHCEELVILDGQRIRRLKLVNMHPEKIKILHSDSNARVAIDTDAHSFAIAQFNYPIAQISESLRNRPSTEPDITDPSAKNGGRMKHSIGNGKLLVYSPTDGYKIYDPATGKISNLDENIPKAKNPGLKVWNSSSGSVIYADPTQTGVILLNFSADGNRLFYTTRKSELHIADLTTKKHVKKFSLPVMPAKMENIQNELLIVTNTGDLGSIDIESGKYTQISTGNIVLFYVSRNREIAAVLEYPRSRCLGNQSALNSIDCAVPDSKKEFSGIRIWQIASRKEIRTIRSSSRSQISNVILNPTRDELSYFENGKITREGIKKGKPVKLPIDNASGFLAYSKDGNTIAASQGSELLLFEVKSNRLITRLSHDKAIAGIIFGRDGNHLITTTGKQGHIWDWKHNRKIGTIQHDDNINYAEFIDSYTLFTSGRYSTKVSTFDPSQMIRSMCSRLTRNLTSDEWHMYQFDGNYRKTCLNL